MEHLNSRGRGNLSFQNRTIYSFYHHKSNGKVKDKEHLNLRCLLQVGPGTCSYFGQPVMGFGATLGDLVFVFARRLVRPQKTISVGTKTTTIYVYVYLTY